MKKRKTHFKIHPKEISEFQGSRKKYQISREKKMDYSQENKD